MSELHPRNEMNSIAAFSSLDQFKTYVLRLEPDNLDLNSIVGDLSVGIQEVAILFSNLKLLDDPELRNKVEKYEYTNDRRDNYGQSIYESTVHPYTKLRIERIENERVSTQVLQVPEIQLSPEEASKIRLVRKALVERASQYYKELELRIGKEFQSYIQNFKKDELFELYNKLQLVLSLDHEELGFIGAREGYVNQLVGFLSELGKKMGGMEKNKQLDFREKKWLLKENLYFIQDLRTQNATAIENNGNEYPEVGDELFGLKVTSESNNLRTLEGILDESSTKDEEEQNEFKKEEFLDLVREFMEVKAQLNTRQDIEVVLEEGFAQKVEKFFDLIKDYKRQYDDNKAGIFLQMWQAIDFLAKLKRGLEEGGYDRESDLSKLLVQNESEMKFLKTRFDFIREIENDRRIIRSLDNDKKLFEFIQNPKTRFDYSSSEEMDFFIDSLFVNDWQKSNELEFDRLNREVNEMSKSVLMAILKSLNILYQKVIDFNDDSDENLDYERDEILRGVSNKNLIVNKIIDRVINL